MGVNIYFLSSFSEGAFLVRGGSSFLLDFHGTLIISGHSCLLTAVLFTAYHVAILLLGTTLQLPSVETPASPVWLLPLGLNPASDTERATSVRPNVAYPWPDGRTDSQKPGSASVRILLLGLLGETDSFSVLPDLYL